MIAAVSVKDKMLVSLSGDARKRYFLERKDARTEKWLSFCGGGFFDLSERGEEEPRGYVDVNPPVLERKPIGAGDFLDNFALEDTLYAYRRIDCEKENPADEDWEYSNWARACGNETKIGYTFGNYRAPDGKWGTVVTEDDIRYTYLWGTDFKATNGQSYTDGQIKFFIEAATEEIERKLGITIKKRRIRCDAAARGLEKGADYDIDEAMYDFKLSKISRYGMIRTRRRPVLAVHSLELLQRGGSHRELAGKVALDREKGAIKLLERPWRPSDTAGGIGTAIYPYGSQTINPNMFYAIDYDAGYETSDDVPGDLRQIIGKQCAVSLLNIIGDGLMSGFSSSSLSMDGLSESFSSTQSATSAYFGARIKEYKDDIEDYIKANKYRFNNMPIGSV